MSEVTKHLPSDVVNNALDFFEKVEIRKSKTDKFIDIPIKTKQGNLYEPVADINGIVIPAYFEYVNNKKMSIYDILVNRNQVVNIKLDINMPTPELLKLATQYSAFSSGYNYKMNQIKEYNWMEDEKLDDAVDRLELVINKNARFEVEVSNPELKVGKVIVGRMDCMDGDTIWEFKCTRELDSDHFIQLAIYALLNENMRAMLGRKNNYLGGLFALLNGYVLIYFIILPVFALNIVGSEATLTNFVLKNPPPFSRIARTAEKAVPVKSIADKATAFQELLGTDGIEGYYNEAIYEYQQQYIGSSDSKEFDFMTTIYPKLSQDSKDLIQSEYNIFMESNIIDGEPLLLQSIRVVYPNLKIVALLNPFDVHNPYNQSSSSLIFNDMYSK